MNGFKFGGVAFSVGIVEVAIDHIDTNKMTTTTRISWPMFGGKMMIKMYSGRNWQDTRSLSVECEFTQDPPPEPPEEDQTPWENDESGDDA